MARGSPSADVMFWLSNAAAVQIHSRIMAIPTLGAENRTLLSPQLLLVTLVWLSWPSVTPAVDYGNEVTVWIEQGQAVAISVVNGSRDFSRPARDRNRLRHQRHQRRCRDFAPAAGFLAVPSLGAREIAI